MQKGNKHTAMVLARESAYNCDRQLRKDTGAAQSGTTESQSGYVEIYKIIQRLDQGIMSVFLNFGKYLRSVRE